MCVYGHPTHPIFQPPTLTFFIGNYSTLIFADKVSISLKGGIALPWDRQVLGEWNHLFFFTYEIKNVSFTDH
jgi:hypothetical protein